MASAMTVLQHRHDDADYASGRILGSMGTHPHPAAELAHRTFLNANLGDPGHVAGSRRVEQMYVRILVRLARGRARSVAQVTSGASEANILAMAWMRLRTRHREVIVPRTGHFSLEKAARFLGLKLRIADIDDAHRVDVNHVQRLIGPRTAGIVGIAGTTQVGSIDPLRELGRLAAAHQLPLHVDAAFGGYVLPFLRPRRAFGFDLPGVETVAMDTHKMAQGTIGAGALLFRDAQELEELAVDTPYLSTPRQRGILGTRSAGPVAAAVAAWNALGPDGYRRTVATCMQNTRHVAETLEDAGIQPLVAPELNILAIPHKDPGRLHAALARRGWRLNILTRLKALRLVVMPHVTRKVLDRFLPDLLRAYPAAKPRSLHA